MKRIHGSGLPAVTAMLLAGLWGCEGLPADSFDGLLGGIGAINAVAPAGEPLPELGEAVIVRVINLSDDQARVIVRYLIADFEVRRTDIQVPGGSTAQDIGPDNAFQVEITATRSDGTPLPSMLLTLGVDFVGGQVKEYVIRPGEPQDRCPDDPAKTEPGVCGCGVPDIDTDGDGTPDCRDGCPRDSGKTEPGVCGCGAPDIDADGDGTPDCRDGCPDDPAKTEPGVCGCGVPDIDTDGDGTPDCRDGCPDDSAKTDPGVCGCGAPDIDTDGDGTPDCRDGCPGDPAKTEPGVCGCGAPDVDADDDGVADCIDNCPGKANGDQADCDGDGVGDACVIQDCPQLPACGDCNENGVPDSCDLDVGGSIDLDGNGIPDECEGPPPPCRLHVRAGAAGGGDGSDWEHAFTDLQDALDAARSHGGGCEIWIAAGTYKPDRGTGDRTASFVLPCGVSLLGGFRGMETGADQRNPDPMTNGCVLSGDLVGDDGPDGCTGAPSRSDNSYHIAIFDDDECDADTVIDGLAIVGGNANGPSPHFKGGGLLISFLQGHISNCLFTGNSASSGGAVFLYDSDPVFDRCIFAFNRADNYAGAMEVYESRAMLSNSLLVANTSGGKGGAIDFWLNRSGPRLAVTIANCTFAGNGAAAVGGGLSGLVGSQYQGTVEIINSIFWGNTDGQSDPQSAQISVSGVTPAISYSCIQGLGGGHQPLHIRSCTGSGNIHLDPGFTSPPPPSPAGPFGTPGWDLGDLSLTPWSPCIDAGSNAAPSAGGPLDLAGGPRRLDDSATPDTGCGDPPVVDMGAYEFPFASPARQACCFDGDDCSDLPVELCFSWDGSPQGPGTTCATTDCAPATQACCFYENESCSDLSVDQCRYWEGEPQGPGTTCPMDCGL